MKNKEQIEWLKELIKECEADAVEGKNVACAVLSIQSKLIKLLEQELDKAA